MVHCMSLGFSNDGSIWNGGLGLRFATSCIVCNGTDPDSGVKPLHSEMIVPAMPG
jgi:hypothetical protein